MIGVALLWMAVAGPSGDDAPLPLRMALEDPELRVQIVDVGPERMRLGLSLAVQGRVAIPFGAADSGTTFVSGNVIVIQNRMSYLDLFTPGLGFTVEADLMRRPPPPVPGGPPFERTPAMGGYVAFECDWFGGDSATDDFGTKVSPDTMRLPQVYVGFKAEGTVEENFFGNVNVGLGAAHYPSLMARVQPAGLPATDREFFENAWAFAMELRMHFGWRAGPAAFVFGMGGRLFSPPTAGPTISMDPRILWTLDFDLGLQLNF
jgi:hypothetical protein